MVLIGREEILLPKSLKKSTLHWLIMSVFISVIIILQRILIDYAVIK